MLVLAVITPEHEIRAQEKQKQPLMAKIAFIDFDKALKSHPSYLKSQRSLEIKYRKKMKDLEDQMDGLTLNKSGDNKDKEGEFIISYEKEMQLMAEAQKKISLELYNELQSQVQRYADLHGYDAILNKRPLAKNTKNGIQIDPMPIVIASAKHLDLTDEIIAMLKRMKASESLVRPSKEP
jgi:Skp family chaperone for outer membrane proteins